MTTCEQCGADAVNAQGVCGNCGWQSPEAVYDDESPSLGETRAADFPVANNGAPEPRGAQAALPRFAGTAEIPHPGQPSRVSGPSSAMGMGTNSGATRYCGTCGARIAPGEAFCGQCGTPIGASGGDYGTVNMSAGPASRYQIGADWSTAGGEAATEEYAAPLASAYPRTPPGVPFAATGYGSGASRPPLAGAAPGGSGRTVRIVFGILCLVGSIGSAIAAIIVAIQPPK